MNSQEDIIEIDNIPMRLRAARNAMGLSQKDFAGLGGVTLNTQHRYESGTLPSIEYLLRIGDAGADWYWILSGQRVSDSISQGEARLVDLFRLLGPTAQGAVFTVLECMVNNTHAPSSSVHDKRQDFTGE